MIMAGIPSIGRKRPFQPEITMAIAAAVEFSPRLIQVAISRGANTYTVPKVEAVKIASTLVCTQKANTSTKE